MGRLNVLRSRNSRTTPFTAVLWWKLVRRSRRMGTAIAISITWSKSR